MGVYFVDTGTTRFQIKFDLTCMDFHPSFRQPVFVWPSVLLEAWGTKAKKPHICTKRLVFWRCSLGDKRPSKRYELQAMDATKPCNFEWFW